MSDWSTASGVPMPSWHPPDRQPEASALQVLARVGFLLGYGAYLLVIAPLGVLTSGAGDWYGALWLWVWFAWPALLRTAYRGARRRRSRPTRVGLAGHAVLAVLAVLGFSFVSPPSGARLLAMVHDAVQGVPGTVVHESTRSGSACFDVCPSATIILCSDADVETMRAEIEAAFNRAGLDVGLGGFDLWPTGTGRRYRVAVSSDQDTSRLRAQGNDWAALFQPDGDRCRSAGFGLTVQVGATSF